MADMSRPTAGRPVPLAPRTGDGGGRGAAGAEEAPDAPAAVRHGARRCSWSGASTPSGWRRSPTACGVSEKTVFTTSRPGIADPGPPECTMAALQAGLPTPRHPGRGGAADPRRELGAMTSWLAAQDDPAGACRRDPPVRHPDPGRPLAARSSERHDGPVHRGGRGHPGCAGRAEPRTTRSRRSRRPPCSACGASSTWACRSTWMAPAPRPRSIRRDRRRPRAARLISACNWTRLQPSPASTDKLRQPSPARPPWGAFFRPAKRWGRPQPPAAVLDQGLARPAVTETRSRMLRWSSMVKRYSEAPAM